MSDSFLALYPVDVEVWRDSDSYARLNLKEQGAYMNLWFAAWAQQPHCSLPDDNNILWKRANARSKSEWLKLRPRVLEAQETPWQKTPEGRWIHPVVCETYQNASRLHSVAVSKGRTGGKVSARVRRAKSKLFNKGKEAELEAGLEAELKLGSSWREAGSKPPSPSVTETTDTPPKSPPASAGGERPQPSDGNGKIPAGSKVDLDKAVYRLCAFGSQHLGYRYDRKGRRQLADRLRSGETEAQIRAGYEDLAKALEESDAEPGDEAEKEF